MQLPLLVGLAGGFASAVLLIAATFNGGAAAGGMDGRILLYFLAPLPAFLAGLGWGPVAAVAAAGASGLGCGLLRGPMTGLMIFVSQGLPMALVCYLAQLNRVTVTAPAGPTADARPDVTSVAEWYPAGRLVAAAVLMAGALAFLTVLLLGDLEQIRAFIRKFIETALTQMPGLKERKLEETQIQSLTEIMLYAFPAALALTWLGTFLMNFYIAGRITLASGRLTRPWPDLAALTFPRGFGFGLAIALGLAGALTGTPALLASGFAGALLFAYLLVGLAILHHVSRGKPARPFMLWGVYVGLIVLNPWSGLSITLLGLAEPFLPWRRTPRGGAPRPD